MLKLYNTLTRKKEEFRPIKRFQVGLYACGPTVYDYAHLGHFRAYVFVDVLRRVLEYNTYKVKQVMNITDVGHLVGDRDLGKDKIELGAEREKKTAREIADFYTDDFFKAIEGLNVLKPQIVCKASEHIQEMIDLVRKIEANGFTYRTSKGIYFDTSKLSDYGKLAGLDIEGLKEGARVEADSEKKNPTDFALWRFSPKKQKRAMEWDSPWGKGFPGWHIECTAMSVNYLGERYDIHTGGVDHIAVHHTNEIAQAQGAFGRDIVRFWLHNEFLLVNGKKMSKSLGNIYKMNDILERGFEPLALRYLFLTAHYRNRMNFTWQSLEGAGRALEKLRELVADANGRTATLRVQNLAEDTVAGLEARRWQSKFVKFLNDDLNTPKALALVWDLLKAAISKKDKRELIDEFDRVLGLKLMERTETRIPQEVKILVDKREDWRRKKKWEEADKIRDKIKEMGWEVEDTEEGTKTRKV